MPKTSSKRKNGNAPIFDPSISKAITMTNFEWDRSLDHLSDEEYDNAMYVRKNNQFSQLATDQGVDINNATEYHLWYQNHIIRHGNREFDEKELTRRFYNGHKLYDLELQCLLDYQIIRFYSAYADETKTEYSARSKIELTAYGHRILKLPTPNSVNLKIRCDKKLFREAVRVSKETPINEELSFVRDEITEVLITKVMIGDILESIKQIQSKYKSYTTPYEIEPDFNTIEMWEEDLGFINPQIEIGTIMFGKKEDASEFILKLNSAYTYEVL